MKYIKIREGKSVKICKRCGYENENSAKECEYCGKKLKKRRTGFILFMVFLCMAAVFGAAAFVYYGGYENFDKKEEAYVIDSGYFGRDENGNHETLVWRFYSDNTLIISGRGEMGGFERRGMCYFKSYLERIRCVTIENGVKNVGKNVFNGCELNSLNIGEDVLQIGAFAFANCVNLKEVVLPEKLERIDDGAFMGCTSLKSVKIKNKNCIVSDSAFSNTSGELKITYGNEE